MKERKDIETLRVHQAFRCDLSVSVLMLVFGKRSRADNDLDLFEVFFFERPA